MDWSSCAFVFPGQASQVVGMGADVAQTIPAAQSLFDRADAALGYSLSDVCFNGPDEQLNRTVFTQPALYVTSLALLAALQGAVPGARPAMMAGHSLGELTALAAAGALEFEDGLRLVQRRGEVMEAAGEAQPGAMAAIIGLDAAQVRDVCAQASAQTGRTLVLANDNCPGQIVISGDPEALEAGLTLAKAAGARRALKLAVSIASHSPLMAQAASQFAGALEQTAVHEPRTTVYLNVTAAPLGSASEIRGELEQQLTHSVRWTEQVQRMIQDGARTFVEVGPKDVLAGLIRRIDNGVQVFNVSDAATLQTFVTQASSTSS